MGSDLNRLNDRGREGTAFFDARQIRWYRQVSVLEGDRQQVRGRNRVLNGKIDADSSGRRHGVGRVADAKQAGPVPCRRRLICTDEQLDLVPILHSSTRRPDRARSADGLLEMRRGRCRFICSKEPLGMMRPA